MGEKFAFQRDSDVVVQQRSVKSHSTVNLVLSNPRQFIARIKAEFAVVKTIKANRYYSL